VQAPKINIQFFILEISSHFSFFVDHFCLPRSGDTDPIESGSNPDPDHKQCLTVATVILSGENVAADDLYLNMKEYLGRNLREACLIPQNSDLSTVLRLASHFCPHNVGHHLVSGSNWGWTHFPGF
jgi:hypothetical protein